LSTWRSDEVSIQTSIQDSDSLVIELALQVLSQYPRIVVLPRFIDNATAAHFMNLASSRLHESGLALRKGETKEGTKGVRTSQGAFLSRNEDPSGILEAVERRISQFVGIPVANFEVCNIEQLASHYPCL
jgi:prolyl 4-hydroxylase